jgi:PAS domain S-box-containing protein
MLLTHYNELSGYKANIVFGQPIETLIGFNRNEEILCSIINKAFTIVDVKGISDHWMRRTYDYRVKVVQARLPWLISATSLSLIVMGLILVMFYRKHNEGKRLANLVAEKTSTITAIFNGTPDIIFHKDLNSCFTECNEAMEIFINLPKKKIIGKPASQVFNWPYEKVALHIAREQEVFNEMQQIIAEEIVSSYDGASMIFETIRTPLIHDGKVTGLVGIARDITRRKAAEDEAKRASAEAMRAYAEAENASEAKSHFLANMSHEMRTPMNVIVGLTDLTLEESNVPGNIMETMKKINTAGNTLMGLINDVLDISKIEAGKLELSPVQYSVPSLLNDIITLNMIRIEEKPVTFNLDIDENLPCTLFGDDLRVKQILKNVLSNAFKYTKEGNGTLGVSCNMENTTDTGVLVSLYVSDTGIGIREEDVLKLFSDYNQVDTRANRTIEGTGLGLSITKKFVELMHGEISVKSEYGKGTTFRASIRQGFVTDKKIGKETADNLCKFRYSEKKLSPGERLVRSNLSYARVLVVDDFPMNLDVAAGMLGKYKMKVDCVSSGQDAIKRITAGEPVYDAVFMDHMMPGMDGVEATKEIRALGTKYAQEIPVIALTANVIAGNEQMFMENGFNAYLPKPFNAAALDKVVQRWVRDKSRE